MKKLLPALPVFAAMFVFHIGGIFGQGATLSIQGVLLQDNGQAAPDSTYQLAFRLWKSAMSTAPANIVWSDVFNDVKTVGGKYNVVLGSGAALNAPFDQTYYLGVSIGNGTGTELMPRPRLTAAPAGLALVGTSNKFTSDGSVGIGTITPNVSAILDVQSTTKGVLIPRMTDAQKKAMAQPDAGTLVYQTDQLKGYYYYDGTRWQHITGSVRQIGELYGGGIIFYTDAKGQHGLIAALTDQSAGAQWGCLNQPINNAKGTARGSGLANTESIADSCTTGVVAAKICYDLVLNGYSDWYLPSKDELALMYTNLKAAGLGNFANASYWSSSAISDTNAWSQNFSNGTQNSSTKPSSFRVRAIRRF